MKMMVSVDEALACLNAHRLALPAEVVAVEQACGRRLAEPVVARVTQPPAAVSAMDGYAVRLSDVQTPGATLQVTGEAPAGKPFKSGVRTGEAVRIFTGAHLPSGSDHIVIQEDVDRRDGEIICRKGYTAAEFVRQAGIDFTAGDVLIEPGTVLTPSALALAAAANHGTFSVFTRPRVGILANGDELRPPGSALAEGEVANSNLAGLSALIHDWGGEAVDLGIASDSISVILERIDDPTIDIFLPVGGASVGDHDHMLAAFEQAGFELIFQKIAVKPGKPTWFSRRDNRFALGLPGNPASAIVCAHLFLKALLRQSFNLQTLKAQLEMPLPANGNREEFLRGKVRVSEDGRLLVCAVTNQDSSLLKPFLTSNCLIRRTIHAAAEPKGAIIDVVMIGPLP